MGANMAGKNHNDEARYADKGVAARQAEIIDQPQRIGEVDATTLDDDALALIHRIRGSAGAERQGPIPGYFLTMVKHPDIFRCQLELGTALFKGQLPPRERELAVLRIGWLCRAPYEWGEHVDISQRCGVTSEEITRIIEGSTADGWSSHDRAILRGVEELLDNQIITDETWATLAQSWSEAQLIEFPMMVGQYVATAYVQNSLRIRLAKANPGLTHR
jgi:4-carboxymuconolactone decarboxylase